MKFSCEKALLLGAVTTAGRVSPAKTTMPILEGILLSAYETGLTISGYNLETGIVTSLEAQVAEPGHIVVNSKLFSTIIRTLPDDMVTVSTQNTTVYISCGQASFEIAGTPGQEFPELPSVDQGNSLSLTQSNMRSMISQVLFAVSTDESRPIHNGVLFEVEDKELTMVAVDGYRLALRREPLAEKSGEISFSFVVPGAALSEVEHICTDVDELATLTLGQRHVMFKTGNTVLITRRLEGEFLNYRQTIPKSYEFTMLVEKSALQTSVDRVALLINDKLKNPLRCRFEKDALTLSALTALGSSRDTCPMEGDGKGLEVGFNNRYLLDALKAAPAAKVQMAISSPQSPCVILPPQEGENNFLYMVLPIRLHNDL